MLVESAKVKFTRKKVGFLQFLKLLFQPFSSAFLLLFLPLLLLPTRLQWEVQPGLKIGASSSTEN
jgi:hypothetical protein